jgi:drug/metabolite transporter (DMT)-like permease
MGPAPAAGGRASEVRTEDIPRRSRIVAFVCLAGGVVILGFAAIFVRWADAPGAVTAFYRMLIGSTLITPFFLAGKLRSRGKLSRRGTLMAVLGGTLFGCDMAIWMTAVGISGATMPTLMANTAPVWVGLGALVIMKERQTAGFWLGLLMSVGGAALVFGHDLGSAAGLGLGVPMGLVAALFYAGFYLATQEGRRYLDTLSYLWISTLAAAGALLVINLALDRPLSGYDRPTYLSFLALGGLVQFAGWLLINFAQGYIRASVVSPVLLGQPVLTALLAVPLLGESFSVLHLAGGLVVLAGVYIVVWTRPP